MEAAEQRDRSRGIAFVAAGGGIGAAAAAALAGACCVGPIAVSVLGIGGAVAAAGLAPYRALLLGASFLLLGMGFWLVYRPPRVAGAACRPGAGRGSKRILWLATAIIAVSFTLPYWIA